MKTNNMKWFLVGAITVTAGLSVMATVNIPNTFSAGTPIKAADVNANFSSLKTAVDALQANPVTAPLNLEKAGANVLTVTGGGSGVGGPAAVANSSLIVSNTNATVGIGAYISSFGADATLIVAKGGSANGQLIKGFGPGGVDAFRVDVDGSAFFKIVTNISDRNLKTNFSSVNSLDILEKVMRLPISRWNYKSDRSSVRHVGPMAQDFRAAFKLNGNDDKHISTVDEGGVALAAIQGLNKKLEIQNKKLELQNAKLRASLANLEVRLSTLEGK